MIEIEVDDFTSPQDCEIAIMALHGIKHAIRVRNYQMAFAQLTALQQNQLLDDSLFSYKWAFANIEQDKKENMNLFCAECHNPSGKYLLCPECEKKRTRYTRGNTPKNIKNENETVEIQETPKGDNIPKTDKKSTKAKDKGKD